MHAITFQLKRAHLCAVAMGRRLFRGTPGRELEADFDGVPDMTPARFDILYLLHRARDGRVGHGDLCRTLGLARATISKAIKRLVELGLVESGYIDWWNDEDRRDRRFKFAWLTEEGRRRIRRALYLVFTGRRIARHLRDFARQYAGSRPRKGATERLNEALDDLWMRTIHLAEHLGNRASLVYRLRCGAD